MTAVSKKVNHVFRSRWGERASLLRHSVYRASEKHVEEDADALAVEGSMGDTYTPFSTIYSIEDCPFTIIYQYLPSCPNKF